MYNEENKARLKRMNSLALEVMKAGLREVEANWFNDCFA
jgi:hypothetical protein